MNKLRFITAAILYISMMFPSYKFIKKCHREDFPTIEWKHSDRMFALGLSTVWPIGIPLAAIFSGWDKPAGW